VIDGKAAAADGYPDVKVKYTSKLCNFNDVNDAEIISPESMVEFFYPDSDGQVFIFDEEYGGEVLKPGECKTTVGMETISTKRAKYFMKSLFQGPQTNSAGAHDGYCYAYSFNKIDFKYDYGLGECKVNVSDVCIGAQAQWCDSMNDIDDAEHQYYADSPIQLLHFLTVLFDRNPKS